MSDRPMTLAEAIRLGSLHMKPEFGEFHNRAWTAGCAIGMAQFAHGKVTQTELRQLHPVLNEYSLNSGDIFTEITGKFDYEVSNTRGDGTLTLDQLCEWVAAQEREFEAKQQAAAKATLAPAKRKPITKKVARKSQEAKNEVL